MFEVWLLKWVFTDPTGVCLGKGVGKGRGDGKIANQTQLPRMM